MAKQSKLSHDPALHSVWDLGRQPVAAADAGRAPSALLHAIGPAQQRSELGTMRYAWRICFAVLIVVSGILLWKLRAPPLPPLTSQFSNDWTGIMLSVTKSFGITRTYYVGSDNKWSYFKTMGEQGLFTPMYRKCRTSQMKLRRTFPFHQGKGYRIERSDLGM